MRRGHEVGAACRGEVRVRRPRASGTCRSTAPAATADEVAAAVGPGWDAVVDVARHPSWVRAAVAACPAAHWVFVSTVNVYADERTPGGRPGTLPLHEAVRTDEELGPAPTCTAR